MLRLLQTFDQEDDLYDEDKVRHAETPELAQEALVDSAILIYKSQIEVAFREQTAGHNALLLFVGLALQLMEEQLFNAFKELDAKEAEVRPPHGPPPQTTPNPLSSLSQASNAFKELDAKEGRVPLPRPLSSFPLPSIVNASFPIFRCYG